MSARSRKQVWGMPVLVGALSLVGVGAGLVGEGMFDAVSWIALAIPVSVGLWFSLATPAAPDLVRDSAHAEQPE